MVFLKFGYVFITNLTQNTKLSRICHPIATAFFFYLTCGAYDIPNGHGVIHHLCRAWHLEGTDM